MAFLVTVFPLQKRPSVTSDHVDDDTVVYDIKFKNDEFAKLLKVHVHGGKCRVKF